MWVANSPGAFGVFLEKELSSMCADLSWLSTTREHTAPWDALVLAEDFQGSEDLGSGCIDIIYRALT